MKKRETISSWQMAMLFLSFLTGSAIVNIPAPLTGAAKNGAWVSLWIANGLGTVLLACILYLHRKYPEMTFIEYSRKTVGKVVAAIFACTFLLFSIMMLGHITGDIAEFFKSTMMRETPDYIFTSLTILTAALTVRAGIEVMARMFMILLFSMFFFSILVLVLNLTNYHPQYLMPLFPDGIKPVLHGAYLAYGFPYAELIVFSMILPFVRKEREPLDKFMYGAIFINGLSLSIVIVCTIMAVGPMSANVKFSLFILARLVEVRDFIERIESVIGMSLIAGSYMKTTIALFAINLAITHLFRLKDDKILIFPVAMIGFLLSLTMYENELEFAEHVGVVWTLYITVAGVVPVLVLTLVTMFKSRRRSAK